MGDDPEAAEGALAQAYAPRNPFAEVLGGELSLRGFRVCLEALPPGNALDRSRHGEWTSPEASATLAVVHRLQELYIQTVNLWRPTGQDPVDVTYLEAPKPKWLAEADRAEAAARAEEERLLDEAMEATRRAWFSGS